MEMHLTALRAPNWAVGDTSREKQVQGALRNTIMALNCLITPKTEKRLWVKFGNSTPKRFALAAPLHIRAVAEAFARVPRQGYLGPGPWQIPCPISIELDIQPGDRVFHLKCGSGYYIAIMAQLVDSSGQAIASEVDDMVVVASNQTCGIRLSWLTQGHTS